MSACGASAEAGAVAAGLGVNELREALRVAIDEIAAQVRQGFREELQSFFPALPPTFTFSLADSTECDSLPFQGAKGGYAPREAAGERFAEAPHQSVAPQGPGCKKNLRQAGKGVGVAGNPEQPEKLENSPGAAEKTPPTAATRRQPGQAAAVHFGSLPGQPAGEASSGNVVLPDVPGVSDPAQCSVRERPSALRANGRSATAPNFDSGDTIEVAAANAPAAGLPSRHVSSMRQISGSAPTGSAVPHTWAAGAHRRGFFGAQVVDGGDWVEKEKSESSAVGHGFLVRDGVPVHETSASSSWALCRSVHPDRKYAHSSKVQGRGAAVFKRFQTWTEYIVCSSFFDYFVGVLIFSSAVVIYLQTDYMATHIGQEVPLTFRVLEACFCAIFAAELSLRLFVFGPRFFFMQGWKWNLFDTLVVMVQVVEEILSTMEHWMSFSAIRTLRVVRVLRVFRVVRLLHLVRELRTMASAIGAALRPFFWTLSLLGIFIFIAGVYFMQIIIDRVDKETFSNDDGLQTYWPNLPASLLSLFQALMGGVDWENVVNPLILQVSPWMTPVFLAYVAFASFVMLNLITGIFFDLTFSTIRDTKDRELVHQVKELFLQSDVDCSGKISFKEFQRQVHNPTFESYFKVIDLDPSEARGLFDLLDTNGDDEVDAQDFVMGCLRLRGPARAIDLATLAHDMKHMLNWCQMAVIRMEERQAMIINQVEVLQHGSSDCPSGQESLQGCDQLAQAPRTVHAPAPAWH